MRKPNKTYIVSGHAGNRATDLFLLFDFDTILVLHLPVLNITGTHCDFIYQLSKSLCYIMSLYSINNQPIICHVILVQRIT